MLEHRHYPRFALEVNVEVASHAIGRVAGRTIDISESGIGILLVAELEVAATVGLNFESPVGWVHTWAVARNKSAFRYGFEFIPSEPSQEQIKNTCSVLAELETHTDRTSS